MWERLIQERKLGALALLRNLRNMQRRRRWMRSWWYALGAMRTDRVLPFRFIAAARHAPQWERALEQAMFIAWLSQPEADGQDRAAGRRFRQHGRALSRGPQ